MLSICATVYYGWLVLLVAHLVTARQTEVYAVNGTWSFDYTVIKNACDGTGYVETTLFDNGFEQIFVGTRARWLFVEADDGATFDIYQDGLYVDRRTTYRSTSRLSTCEAVTYDTGTLAMGTHNLTIYHAGADLLSPISTIPALRSMGVIVEDPFEDPVTTSSTARGGPTGTGTGTGPGGATATGSSGTGIPEDESSKSVSPGIVVGGVIGGIVAFTAMGGIIIMCFRRNKTPTSSSSATPLPTLGYSKPGQQPISYAFTQSPQAVVGTGHNHLSPNHNPQYANYNAQAYHSTPQAAATSTAWGQPEPAPPYQYNHRG